MFDQIGYDDFRANARIMQRRVNEPKAERLPHVVVARIQWMDSAFKRPAGKS
jgi:hypothetical protein